MPYHTRSGNYGRLNDYLSASPRYNSRLSVADSNRWKYHASGVPFLGDFVRASDQQRYLEDYLKNTGLTWADVKYPSLASGAGSMARAVSGVGGSLAGGAMYSRILRMYR